MNMRITIGAALIIGAVCGALWWMSLHTERALEEAAAASCDARFEDGPEKIHCWYGIMEAALEKDGIKTAFGAFTAIYEKYRLFAQTGCHVHAHAIGDMAYYRLYASGGEDLTMIDFPQETTACGYGFFHGFLEHAVEDRPTIEYVTDTCKYLIGELSVSMGDIGNICYHGSGHGFTLARLREMSKSDWGNLDAFVREPLRKCDSLPGVTVRQREECREGVFNVAVVWMENKEYGFSYDYAKPFAPCQPYSGAWKQACVFEMAQKLDVVAKESITKLQLLIGSERDPELRKIAFKVAMTGAMQSMAGSDDHVAFGLECKALDEETVIACTQAIVAGLFEHGEPQREYEKAIEYCRQPFVVGTPAESTCWDAVSRRLSRFYDSEKRKEICALFPGLRNEACRAESLRPR